MRDLHQGLERTDFEGSVELTSRAICQETGLRSNGTCPLIGAPFLPGTEPRATCPTVHPPPDVAEEGGNKKYESLWKRKARELSDICDKDPQLCEDEEILVELPESCDPDEGTCPGWVIDDLIETFESFNFGHSPIEKVGTQPLITKWTPTGP